MLKENEVLDDLQLDNLKIIQNREGYCFTSDAVILSNFISANKNSVCVEIGSGSGVISILVQHKNKPSKIICFEIQTRLADMSKRSIKLNNKQDKIFVINDKIQNYAKYIANNSVDVVYSNPPYRKHNSSVKSNNAEKNICKYEEELTLDELCSIASKLLKYKGKFFVVYDASRSVELLFKLKLNKIEPKRMFFTAPDFSKSPTLIVVEGVKGGKEGITILPELINDDKKDYISQLQNYYKKG